MLALRTGEQVRDVVMGVYNPREHGYRWINVNALPLFRPGEGRAYQVYTVFEDITERRRAEEALIRSEKLASVGRMAATIAHEINNPLAAVMNSLYIASGLDISPTAHEYLDIADAELKRIAHLTKQALGFYRESASPELVEVSAVMDSAVDLMKSKIKLKQVSVQKEYAQAAPIMAVTGELRQVFANLFANSLDAIEPGGKIRIRVSPCNHSRNGNRCVRITVADNGQGIPPQVLPHIFEPLYTTKTSVGTGLGLWVGKQLVEKHGGVIRVHSRVGGKYRGSAFSVVLPAEGMPTEKTASAPLGL
jgi:signal transduction histidine kinase